ncbi:MAG: hypothetical protein IIX12_06450 [Alistipes sp.]|nr:hypothetical protein [Alistipes sp.]
MKVKVVKEFHDKDNFAKVYTPGTVLEVSPERKALLKSLGLVVEIREKKEK